MNVPNAISLGRILVVPVGVWLILADTLLAAFWLFVAAAASDAIDGFFAKRFQAVTKLGGYLDPIADKALLVSVFLSLGAQGYIAMWLVILVVFRDLLIVGGALLYQAVTQRLRMEPLRISKVNTAAQLVFCAVVLGSEGFNMPLGETKTLMTFIVGATTFLSGAAYVVEWSRRAAEFENGSNNRKRNDAP